MQRFFFSLNQTKSAFSAYFKKYSTTSKNGNTLLFSNAKDSLFKAKLSLLLSISGFYATKEILCDDSRFTSGPQPELYSWGGNQYGQLGIGSDLTKPLPERNEMFENTRIVLIQAKPGISAALCQDGKIFTWGSGKTGALGHQNLPSTNASLPAILESLMDLNFTQIGCGRYHMAAITDQGKLYTWGNMDHGVLGREVKSTENQSKKAYNPKSTVASKIQPPGLVEGELKDKKCIQVVCGIQHTICLTSDNQVYSWGSSRRGALGYSSVNDVPLPQKVDFFEGKKVIKVAAGSDFNYALTQDGKVYAWGNNYFGQLGIQSGDSGEIPALISPLFGVKTVDISCGDNFGAAISDKGKLYSWGCGNEGQLGHGNKTDLKSPKLLEFNKKIVSVDCGSSHTGFITSDGELYMFGRGREGQLGRADAVESSVAYRTTPQLVQSFKNKRVLSVACGGDHTLALVQ